MKFNKICKGFKFVGYKNPWNGLLRLVKPTFVGFNESTAQFKNTRHVVNDDLKSTIRKAKQLFTTVTATNSILNHFVHP